MPLKPEVFNSVSAGLRRYAEEGRFVPYAWIAEIDPDGGDCKGCGKGVVGWLVAVATHGVDYANEMLPVGSGQKEVNKVLLAAGVTKKEIRALKPSMMWQHFDRELLEVCGEGGDFKYDDYIAKSRELAEYFIQRYQTIVDDDVEDVVVEFRSIHATRPAQAELPLFKSETLVLEPSQRVFAEAA